MPKYAAFLRAVNLGPTRKVSSADLRELFEAEGFDDVNTFRTSGNVVFTAPRSSDAKLRARIEKALEQKLGYDVTVFVRSAAEVQAIASHTPFPRKLVEASAGKLQVALLGSKPAERTRKEALALASDDDRLALDGRELYWLPERGVGRSELDQKALQKLLGPTTVRTMGTMRELARKYLED